jgi:hypothetical protein
MWKLMGMFTMGSSSVDNPALHTTPTVQQVQVIPPPQNNFSFILDTSEAVEEQPRGFAFTSRQTSNRALGYTKWVTAELTLLFNNAVQNQKFIVFLQKNQSIKNNDKWINSEKFIKMSRSKDSEEERVTEISPILGVIDGKTSGLSYRILDEGTVEFNAKNSGNLLATLIISGNMQSQNVPNGRLRFGCLDLTSRRTYFSVDFFCKPQTNKQTKRLPNQGKRRSRDDSNVCSSSTAFSVVHRQDSENSMRDDTPSSLSGPTTSNSSDSLYDDFLDTVDINDERQINSLGDLFLSNFSSSTVVLGDQHALPLDDQYTLRLDDVPTAKVPAHLLGVSPNIGKEEEAVTLIFEVEHYNIKVIDPESRWTAKFGESETTIYHIKPSLYLGADFKDNRIYHNEETRLFVSYAAVPDRPPPRDPEMEVPVRLYMNNSPTAETDTVFKYIESSTTYENQSAYYKDEKKRPHDGKYGGDYESSPFKKHKGPSNGSSQYPRTNYQGYVNYLQNVDHPFAREVLEIWSKRIEDKLVGDNKNEEFEDVFINTAKRYNHDHKLDQHGRTPAFRLTYDSLCPPRLLELLFHEAEYDVNATDNYGCTCYHWAMIAGADVACAILEECGVNVDHVNYFGYTAEQYGDMFNPINEAALEVEQKLYNDKLTLNERIKLAEKLVSVTKLAELIMQNNKKALTGSSKERVLKIKQVLTKNTSNDVEKTSSAITFGGAILEWNHNSYCRPICCSHASAVFAFDIKELKNDEILLAIIKLAKVIREWNINKIYNDKTCNSQHFVDACLSAIGISTKLPKKVQDYFNSVKAHGKCIPHIQLPSVLTNTLDHRARETFGIANDGSVLFKSHQQLDDFCRRLGAVLEHEKEWYEVLKGFDRGFWLRQLYSDQHSSETNTHDCYFGDPEKTNTQWSPSRRTRTTK